MQRRLKVDRTCGNIKVESSDRNSSRVSTYLLIMSVYKPALLDPDFHHRASLFHSASKVKMI